MYEESVSHANIKTACRSQPKLWHQELATEAAASNKQQRMYVLSICYRALLSEDKRDPRIQTNSK